MGQVVATVELPYLPPMSLSKNARCHWRVTAADFAALKTDAGWQLREAANRLTWPHVELVMDIEWWAVAPLSDADAVLARCAACMDAAETVGLVEDDAQIEIGRIVRTRVKHKTEQRVVVTFREAST